MKVEMKMERSQQTTQTKIISDYYQLLYANKMDNVEEMDKFLEKYNFPKLNQEEMPNITHYQRNANQNHNEVPSHGSLNRYHQNVYKQ